jgi:toxin ParE1/3/4
MGEDRRPVIWSPEAHSDLSDIWDYYARTAGRPVADRIVLGIGEVCGLLRSHPLAGRGRPEIRPGLRSIAATPHVVFYRVTDGVAEIVRVLDARRDLDDLFADEA